MTSWRVLFLATLLSLAAATAAGMQEVSEPSEADAADIAAAVNGWLAETTTLSADFVQTDAKGGTARGRLYLKRPGRLRFEYSDGTPLLLVSDGEVLSFIDYGVGQVTRWPIGDTALAPLVDPDFRIDGENAMLGALPLETGARLLLVSLSDSDKPDRGNLTLAFSQSAEDGVRLLGWEVMDAEGGITRIDLENVEKNRSLAASLWQFDDPRRLPSERRRRGR